MKRTDYYFKTKFFFVKFYDFVRRNGIVLGGAVKNPEVLRVTIYGEIPENILVQVPFFFPIEIVELNA